MLTRTFHQRPVPGVKDQDLGAKDQDQDKDFTLKDQDKDQDLSIKDQDKDKVLSKCGHVSVNIPGI